MSEAKKVMTYERKSLVKLM